MTKADVVAETAKKIGLEKYSIMVAIEDLMNVVKIHLTAGENIYLRGFGTF